MPVPWSRPLPRPTSEERIALTLVEGYLHRAADSVATSMMLGGFEAAHTMQSQLWSGAYLCEGLREEFRDSPARHEPHDL